jgi:hypothetical protein
MGGVSAYLQRWPDPPATTNEMEFTVRLRSPWTGRPSNTFDLTGRADAVIDHGSHLELIEDKFVGRIDDFKVQRLPLDRQIQLMRYGLWMATGKEVRLVRYRWTKKPSIRQKQTESLTEFCERVMADYLERVDFYTHEEPMFVGNDDLLRIEAELWIWADQVRTARQRQMFPRNTGACSDYGGCAFIPLCLGQEDAESLFHVKPPRAKPVVQGELF